MTFRPVPKPEKPERGTKRCKAHMARVAAMPCAICGFWPVHVHHRWVGRFSQRKASDLETMPLCQRHHDELHRDASAFIERYGKTETAMIAEVKKALYGE